MLKPRNFNSQHHSIILDSINKPSDYKAVFSANKKVISDNFILLYRIGDLNILDSIESSKAIAIRVGIIASKKVGNAVKRNRCKRLLRASVLNSIKKLNDSNANITRVNIVLIARKSLIDANFSKLELEIGSSFNKVLISKRALKMPISA